MRIVTQVELDSLPKKAKLGDHVTIYSGNIIEVNELTIGSHSSILLGNRIIGQGDFTLGNYNLIIYDNYIDVWNNVTIGNMTWPAVKYSQNMDSRINTY